MFHKKVVFALLAFCLSSFASLVSVSGTLASSTTWNADTVVLIGDVTVNTGVVLNVAAGTRVEAAGQYQIAVNGRIVANGATGDSVVFTTQDTAAGWRGFTFNSSTSNDTSILNLCVIEYAKKTGPGGAIAATMAKLRISRSCLQYNTATNGGALYCATAGVVIDSCFFFRNTASGMGGAYYKYHANMPTVTNSTFSDNTAYDGGAVYMDGWFGNFDRCNFIHNFASHYGGGAYVYNGPSNFYNCRFSQDSAGQQGGGLYDCDQYSSYRYYTGCLFDNNRAGASGGGAYIYDYGLGMTSEFVNCTITGNRAPTGGGVLSYAVTVYIINSILWGNSATGSGPQFSAGGTYGYDNTNLYIRYSTVQGGWSSVGGTAYNVRNDTALSTLNPLFVDTLSGNYRLSAGSPCIDSGRVDTLGLGLPPFDLAGLPRYMNGRIDRGVYEYQPPVFVLSGPRKRMTAPAARPLLHFDVRGRAIDGRSSRICVAPGKGVIVSLHKR